MSEAEQKQSNNTIECLSKHAQSILHSMVPWLVCAIVQTIVSRYHALVLHIHTICTNAFSKYSWSAGGKASSQITTWLLLTVNHFVKYLLCFLQDYLMLTALHQSLLHCHLKLQLKL